MGDLSDNGLELKPATLEDLYELASVLLTAMSWDPIVGELLKATTMEEMSKFWAAKVIVGRLTAGEELGATKTWKVVDKNGKIVGWGGLGVPRELTKEQKAAVMGKPELPPGASESMAKFLVFFEDSFVTCLDKHGYDSTKHFMRQNTMVHPDYQRKGIGRMITEKCNQIADEAGAVTFVRARPSSLHLFETEGFKLLEKIEINYEDYGLPSAEMDVNFYILKREPGGK